MRLRSRFLARWPAAGTAESVMCRPIKESACHADVDSNAAQSPLEAARQRLRSRYLAKWPAGQDCAAPGLHQTMGSTSSATLAGAAGHLEAAHQRLHARYVARWPADDAGAQTLPPSCSGKSEADKLHPDDTAQLNRITTWANSLDVPTIIATAPAGHIKHVNLAWERMCGYALKDVVGQKPSILQGDGTDRHAAKALMEGVRKNGLEGQATLLNFKKNGQRFWNSLSVVPIYENWIPPATGKGTKIDVGPLASTDIGGRPLFYVGFLKESSLPSVAHA